MAKQQEKTTQPSDINLPSAPVAKKSKPVRRSEEGLRARKESDRLRVKTRINISYSFVRWRKFKEEMKLRTDGDVANYLLNFYEMRSSTLMNSTGTSMQEPTALSRLVHVSAFERGKHHQQDDAEHQSETRHLASEVDGLQDSFEEMEVTIDDDECNSVKNRLSDLDSDMENVVDRTELLLPGAENSCDEDIYVPVIPQSYKTSELKLECEEEELEPWQKHTVHVRLKEEDDVGELNDDQTDCKPDPSSLQSWAAGQHTLKTEACAVVHQISNNPLSLSSVQSPEIYAPSSNKLQSDQSDSQTLSAPFPPPCLTVIKVEPTET